jgi:hypothetical protein
MIAKNKLSCPSPKNKLAIFIMKDPLGKWTGPRNMPKKKPINIVFK